MTLVLKRTVDPTVEPVSLTEAKNHLRVDIADDDVLISSKIMAAREYFEWATNRALINQTWRLSLNEWPGGDRIVLPRRPLSSVTSVVYTNSAGVATTWAAANYDVDTESDPGLLRLAYGISWPTVTLRPTNPIQITFVAGYGAAATSVPEHMRQAVLLLAGYWYENREGVNLGQGYTALSLPFAIDSLIWMCKF